MISRVPWQWLTDSGGLMTSAAQRHGSTATQLPLYLWRRHDESSPRDHNFGAAGMNSVTALRQPQWKLGKLGTRNYGFHGDGGNDSTISARASMAIWRPSRTRWCAFPLSIEQRSSTAAWYYGRGFMLYMKKEREKIYKCELLVENYMWWMTNEVHSKRAKEIFSRFLFNKGANNALLKAKVLTNSTS